MRFPSLFAFFAIAAVAFAAPAFARENESVQEIMAKVAENQDRAQEMRAAVVYHQDLLLRMLRGNGKTAREEERQYTVTPTPTGTEKQMTSFSGRYEKDGKLIDYEKPGYTYKELDIDGELIDDLANDLADDRKSRDGIAKDLFPLTTSEQKKYAFTLVGRQIYRGREIYRITFKPGGKGSGNEDGTPWEGEILVDVHDFQPVVVTTRLAKGLPKVVTTLLGTNLKGLGFKVTYEKSAEGLWFPATYGSEFEIKALFLYKRRIAVSLRNSNFQRAQVSAKVTFDEPLQIDKTMKVPEIK